MPVSRPEAPSTTLNATIRAEKTTGADPMMRQKPGPLRSTAMTSVSTVAGFPCRMVASRL